jgi:nucleotide-binding universal stress UspA family protein
MIRRILAAVDDSPGGLAAAKEAIDLATLVRAPLRMVHVLALEGDRSDDHASDRGQELLDYLSRLAEPAGVDVETELRHGHPGEQILRAVRAWPADIVVIGRRDTGGVGEPYVGSETREVLEFCECPVLVVPRRVA